VAIHIDFDDIYAVDAVLGHVIIQDRCAGMGSALKTSAMFWM